MEPQGPVRCVLYVDCDRFYFAVEAAERPELAADPRPVIIGHDPREATRGIVTTANDIARALGIHSGLSAAIALRLAPNALFLAPRHSLYSDYSRRVMALLRAHSPLVQQSSIDEAACEWPRGFQREPARALRARILADTGVSVSLGLATSRLVAKMASETAKTDPEHVHMVHPGTEPEFLAPLPIRALVGIGPKSEARLRELGIATIGNLAARPLEDLVDVLGRSHARYLHTASQGRDDSPLQSDRVSKSISAEHTFGTDTTDARTVWEQVQSQSADIAGRLRKEGLQGGEVAIKLRYADWQTITRQMRLTAPADQSDALAAAAAALIRRHWQQNRAIRLIGVRVSQLSTHPAGEQLSLTL